MTKSLVAEFVTSYIVILLETLKYFFIGNSVQSNTFCDIHPITSPSSSQIYIFFNFKNSFFLFFLLKHVFRFLIIISFIKKKKKFRLDPLM